MTIAIILWGVGLGLGCWWVMNLLSGKNVRQTKWDEHLDAGVVLTLCHSCASTLESLFPAYMRKRAERDIVILEKAGLFPALDAIDVAGMQMAGAVAGAVAAPILFSENLFMTALIGCVLGFYLPLYFLKSKRQEYQDELRREFPVALDMITLGLEGGLDFAAGLKEMVENAEDGPVRREFSRIVRDISMGKARAEALRHFSDRVDAIEIKTVVTGLIQAMELGSGIVETLRTQAEQLRFSRLMNAEEAAQKAPTKMMLPMVLFILPCVFIVIFAPLAMSLIAAFKGF